MECQANVLLFLFCEFLDALRSRTNMFETDDDGRSMRLQQATSVLMMAFHAQVMAGLDC